MRSLTTYGHSKPLQRFGFDGIFVVHVSGVAGGHGFKEENVGQVLGDRLVLEAAVDDEEFTFVQVNDAIAQVNLHLSFQDQEKFVLVGVLVPDVLAVELD